MQSELLNICLAMAVLELPADKRFADEAWLKDPVFKRLRQSYVAWAATLDDWLGKSGLQGIERQRARFVLDAAKDLLCAR